MIEVPPGSNLERNQAHKGTHVPVLGDGVLNGLDHLGMRVLG